MAKITKISYRKIKTKNTSTRKRRKKTSGKKNA